MKGDMTFLQTLYKYIIFFSYIWLLHCYEVLWIQNIDAICIDHIQQWKMKEIWNPFYRQNYPISKGFSNFERTSIKPFLQIFITHQCRVLHTKIWLFYAWNGRETDFVFPVNIDVVWGLFACQFKTLLFSDVY